jgi:anti-sigma factor ChrR (cupin superfamily)
MADMTRINADLAQRVVIDTNALPWRASPSPSVWRKRLYLDGPQEAGVVTSIVRYDADSAFPVHDHPGGEEIFVLDGVYSDEHGDYPAGSFLLNPEGYRHAPFSKDGCVIFVKLRQYAGRDRRHVTLDTGALAWAPGRAEGVSVKPLYAQDGYPERISLLRVEAGAGPFPHDHPDGEEVFVLDGADEDEHGIHPAGTWIRSPPGSRHAPWSRDGAELLVSRPPR